MLEVWFHGVEDKSIPNHKRIEFEKAVKLTHELEHKYREEKKIMSGNFTVISTKTDATLYAGTFNFGSYDYPNLYQQIKQMAGQIRVDRDKLADKTFLLDQIEKLTPEEYKKEEIIDKTLLNLDKSKVSRLKKWQRVSVYAVSVIATIGLVTMTVLYIVQTAQNERELAKVNQDMAKQEELSKTYEAAIIGDAEPLKAYLSGKKLNDNQKVILGNLYLGEGDYEKAVEVMGDPRQVVSMITESPKGDKEKVLQAFNELFPTNEGRFDLAYLQKDYELMLNIPTVNMTKKRSEMKTYALLKTGKLDEAKAELASNNNPEMKEKIDKYEVLKAEISTLNEKLEMEKTKKDKDEKLVKKMSDELKKKNDELQTL